MAEIEVVTDDGRRNEEEERERRRMQGGAVAGEPDPVVDVYLERLRGFVERGDGWGAAALREPDGNGYHALQWAALND